MYFFTRIFLSRMPFYGKDGQPIVLRPPIMDMAKLDIPMVQQEDKTLTFSNGSEKFTTSRGTFSYIGFLKNGERHGKGVLLYFSNSPQMYWGRYEGTWDNGVPQGTGVFYNRRGKINMKGSFTKRHLDFAYGIIHVYKGSYLDEKKNGFGSLTHPCKGGLIYEGNWKNDKYHGHGTLYRNSYQKIYEGEFFEGLFHGNGTKYYAFSLEAYGMKNPKEKQGTWNHGNFIQGETFHTIHDDNGMLKYYGEGYFNDEDMYEEDTNFVRHGFGSSYNNQRILIHQGYWMHDRQDGLGKCFHLNGQIEYDGHWKGGKYDNFGKLFDPTGNLLYDGQWKKDKRHGFGTCYKEKSIYYVGSFQNDKFHGKGSCFRTNGSVEFEGIFKHDKRHGKGTKIDRSGSKQTVRYVNDILHGPVIFYEKDGKAIKMKGKYMQDRFIDEAFFSIRKYLESKDEIHLKKINKKDICRFVKEHYQVRRCPDLYTKNEMLNILDRLHAKRQCPTEGNDVTEDLFGNPVETPCRGNDGSIYDLTSMVKLFEKDTEGRYRNIRYVYQNHEVVPNYPVMSNGIRLESYVIILEN
jgi:antitoxin component YwqK of YwqJK toxin-antitoxin module